MPATVERDDAVGFREVGNDAWRTPVHLRAGVEAVDEDDRFAAAFDSVVDRDA